MRAAVAFLFNFNVALYFVTGQPAYQNTAPSTSKRLGQFSPSANLFRVRRDENKLEHHIINFKEDCMLVTSEEGHFFYKSPSDDTTVCGIYMIADADKRIEMIFTYLDVPCEEEGLVAWIDGWELNNQFFPAPRDHPRPEDERFAEFCGTKRVKQVLISSQNAALVQYRIPMRGKGFSITVRHIKNPNPCNILLSGIDDTYTLRNYGKAVNCSLSAVYPASVRVVAMSVGVATASRLTRELETGTIHRCEKRGLSDYVEIGGSAGLDNANLERAENVCGLDSTPAKSQLAIMCEVTTVRLVSGGQFDNSVTISLRKLDENDDVSFFCSF